MDYSHLKSALTANIYAHTVAQREYEKAQALANDWKKRYQKYLKEGREDLLKEAEFRKNIYVKQAANLKVMLDEQAQRLATLKNNIALHTDTSINSFNFPQKESKPSKTPSQVMTNLPATDLENRLHKLERELEAMKAQLINQQAAIGHCLKQNSTALEGVRALLEITSSAENIEPVSTDLSSALMIVDIDDVDDELGVLKAQMLLAATTPSQPQLPQTLEQSARANSHQAVNADLEQLRKQLDEL
jgi:phage shock protein A